MLRVTLAALAVLVAGCGADFSGAYSGDIAANGTCSDGSDLPPSGGAVEWFIEDQGDRLEVTTGGACDITATTSGASPSATINGRTCPPFTQNGTTVLVFYTGGTLTLSSKQLSVTVLGRMDFSGAVVGSCDMTTSGTLTRK